MLINLTSVDVVSYFRLQLFIFVEERPLALLLSQHNLQHIFDWYFIQCTLGVHSRTYCVVAK